METTNPVVIMKEVRQHIEGTDSSDGMNGRVIRYRDKLERTNFLSVDLTAFILEELIRHPDVAEIFGSDHEIYDCIDERIKKSDPHWCGRKRLSSPVDGAEISVVVEIQDIVSKCINRYYFPGGKRKADKRKPRKNLS